MRDLNHLYRSTPSLHVKDCDASGFQWIDHTDNEQSILSFIRRGADTDAPCVVVCNFTPVERSMHQVGVPETGHWAEIINTDAAVYGGANRGNLGGVTAGDTPYQGQPASIQITIPPLATLIFQRTGD